MAPKDAVDATGGVNPPDFDGSVRTDNKLPSPDTLRDIADLPVLDREGHSHTFQSLVTGQDRTLVIFVRHFFCGNCQEYLRVLSAAIPPADLPSDTQIVVIGCGEPPLIDSYAAASACTYPVYADPTRRLYDSLGMVSTLALGSEPKYMKGRPLWASTLRSIGQGLRQLPRGLALKGGNQRQVGGEFLFVRSAATAGATADVRVTWCHRMKTTRDHAEVDELKTLLGLSAAMPANETAANDEATAKTGDAAVAPAATVE